MIIWSLAKTAFKPPKAERIGPRSKQPRYFVAAAFFTEASARFAADLRLAGAVFPATTRAALAANDFVLAAVGFGAAGSFFIGALGFLTEDFRVDAFTAAAFFFVGAIAMQVSSFQSGAAPQGFFPGAFRQGSPDRADAVLAVPVFFL